MVRRILIFIIICIVVSCKLYAQFDKQISHNMFNLLSVNPAYAGSHESINLVVINRNQWSGDYGIKTTVFSGDMPLSIFGIQSGIGINFMSDEIGNYTNLSYVFDYSYKIELEKGYLSLGLSAGVINQSLTADWEYPDEVYSESDPSVPSSEGSGTVFDSGFGVFYFSDNLYGGLSVSHLNKPKPDIDGYDLEVSRSLYVTGGYNHKIEDTAYELQPSLFFKTDGSSFQIDLNTLVRYRKRFWGGLTYRFQDGIILFAGLELKNGIRFGYSYDITTSAIATAGYGGCHEIMIGYNFNINFEKRSKRYKSVRYL